MNIISIILIMSGLLLLGSSRLGVAIKVVAIQGLVLGILPIVKASHELTAGVWFLCISIIAAKGIILPILLNTNLKSSGITREIEPFISYGVSIIAGIIMLILAGWMTVRLNLNRTMTPPIVLSAAFFMVLSGLFLMITRKKALTQILGFLAMENGVYAVGIGLSLEFPFMVELGILLDVVVGVVIMGHLLLHMDKEMAHTDTDRLTELSDNIRLSGEIKVVSSNEVNIGSDREVLK
ncbi:hypothetical protein KKF34_09600 [Myxococcota bacterium]|nr:hypothetical protein [Myxococcota bacterium]MBU1379230.1 hypothetical protein [Myxococcota bacterium]MBU1497118.1 hypothetical protein [Myxococcota bacterium]